MNDLAFALRMLLRRPGYALAAILTLSVAIGANSAIFALLDAVYFRQLPLRDPEHLVELSLTSSKSNLGFISYPEYRRIQQAVPALQDVVAIGARGATLRQGGDTHLLLIDYVSGNYFQSLGVPILLGRGLRPADDTPQAESPVVVINHRLWQERLGGRPDVIGRAIQLNDTMFTVVGVTAAPFLGLSRTHRMDVWVAAAQAPLVVPGLRQELAAPFHRWFELVGRLAPNADLKQVRTQLDTVLRRWREENLEQYHSAALVARSFEASHQKAVGEGAIFLGLVGLVLWMACANVANLTLARNEARRRELAVRAALGASRACLVRQTLVESLLLSVGGASLGLLFGSWLMDLFPALVPPDAINYTLNLRLDTRLILFTTLLTALSTLLVGLVPAWRGSRVDLTGGLKAESPASLQIEHGLGLRDLLVIAQVAVSMVVLVAAGLLVRSFLHSLRVNAGFNPHKNVATFYLVPGLRGYDAAASYRFFEECRRRVSALPAVRRVSYGIRLPAQDNESGWASDFTIPGHRPPPGEEFFNIRYTMVGPDYFEVMGTRILGGRGINQSDVPGSPAAAVINQTMARRFWPGENPIGRKILMGRQDPVERTIVGVAEDSKIADLYEGSEMYLYVPYAQHQQVFALLLVEASGQAELFSAVRKAIAQIDPSVAILDVSSFAGHMKVVLYQERRDAEIAFAIGLLTLLLGSVGIYSVVSLVTARRTKEIGIRMALGAQRKDVLGLVLGRGVRLTLLGTAVGTAGGLAVGRLLQNRLHAVSATDSATFILVAAVLAAVALLATLLPSWRAARVDPVVALRHE